MDAQNLSSSTSIPDVGTSESHLMDAEDLYKTADIPDIANIESPFMAAEDLLGTLHIPLIRASHSDTFISTEQKKNLELLQKERTLFYREEAELNRRLDQIVTFFSNNFGSYLTMMGTGSLFGSLVAKEKSIFIILIVLLAFTFITWVGISFLTALKKLDKMNWEINKVRRNRFMLVRKIQEFEDKLGGACISSNSDSTITVMSAMAVVDEMLNSLADKNGASKEDHVAILRWKFVGAFVYLVVVSCLAYSIHIGHRYLFIFNG